MYKYIDFNSIIPSSAPENLILTSASNRCLWKLTRHIRCFDQGNFFEKRVTERIASDYFQIINTPMEFETIKRRINKRKYKTLGDYKSDVMLMLNNCFKYNGPQDPVYTTGKGIEREFKLRNSQNTTHNRKYINIIILVQFYRTLFILSDSGWGWF